jgi:hypothetical protein
VTDDLTLPGKLRTEEQVVTLIRSGRGYLSTGEIARLYRVSQKTVRRWADNGLVECMRKHRGHRCYPAAQFWDVLDGAGTISAGR